MSACELSHFMDLNMCIFFLKLNADLADDLYQKKPKKKNEKAETPGVRTEVKAAVANR